MLSPLLLLTHAHQYMQIPLKYLGRAGVGLNPPEMPAMEAAELAAALDRCCDDLADAKVLAVDLRFNDGGWDVFALQIAERLAPSGTVAFEKYIPNRNSPVTNCNTDATLENFTAFTPTQPSMITRKLECKPGTKLLPQNSVFILLSLATYSAAEVFALSLYGLDHVRYELLVHTFTISGDNFCVSMNHCCVLSSSPILILIMSIDAFPRHVDVHARMHDLGASANEAMASLVMKWNILSVMAGV